MIVTDFKISVALAVKFKHPSILPDLPYATVQYEGNDVKLRALQNSTLYKTFSSNLPFRISSRNSRTISLDNLRVKLTDLSILFDG